MQQLNGIDAAFLAMDTATVSMDIGYLCILDPSTSPDEVTLDKLTRLVQDRLHLMEPYRRRLVTVPFGLDRPYWIEDSDFDIEFHVRELALPEPGSDKQLADQVARLHARPTDRTRPRWELYLIHGLWDGRKAIYSKTHHAMLDGVLGGEILSTIMDRQARSCVTDPPPDWHGEDSPGALKLLGWSLRTAVTHPGRAFRLGRELLDALPQVLGVPGRPRLPLIDDLLRRPASELVLQSPGFRAPATPFNKPISAHRRYGFCQVPLDDVKLVKQQAGTTVNDVVMALSAGALRRWLQDREALPEGPLVAGVPVSVRTDDDRLSPGNKISIMLAGLPTHLDDPVDRLRACAAAMQSAKDVHGALPATLLADVTQFAMPVLATQAARLVARLRLLERVSPINLVVSNVPGPNEELYYAGCRVLGYYPISALTDGQGLNLTVTSLSGQMHLGVTADRELVPEVDTLVTYFLDELQLLKRATAPTRATPAARRSKARNAISRTTS